MPEAIVHVVLVSFRTEVPLPRREEMLAEQRALGERCGGQAAGILHWQTDWNLDQRKGYQVVQYSIFSDREAFERFRQHPAHAAFVDQLRQLADWVVGDMAKSAD